jgi:hypothetical protein
MKTETKLVAQGVAIGSLVTSMALTFPKITLVIALAFIAWLIIPAAWGAFKDTRG